MSIILSILLFNSLSCWIFRKFIWRGKANIKIPSKPTAFGRKNSMVVMLPGLFTGPEIYFSRLDHITKKAKRADYAVLVEYSNLGWSSKTTARQLKKLFKKTDCRDIEVYTISVGDKVVRQIEEVYIKNIFAINPCTSPMCLHYEHQTVLPVAVRLMEVLCFAAGWLSVLPIIDLGRSNFLPGYSSCKDDEMVKRFSGVRISPALFTDELWEMSINNGIVPTMAYKTSIILSDADTIVDGVAVMRCFDPRNITVAPKASLLIQASHAATYDDEYYAKYNKALYELDVREKQQADYVRRLLN